MTMNLSIDHQIIRSETARKTAINSANIKTNIFYNGEQYEQH
jgi:hypothetical protein